MKITSKFYDICLVYYFLGRVSGGSRNHPSVRPTKSGFDRIQMAPSSKKSSYRNEKVCWLSRKRMVGGWLGRSLKYLVMVAWISFASSVYSGALASSMWVNVRELSTRWSMICLDRRADDNSLLMSSTWKMIWLSLGRAEAVCPMCNVTDAAWEERSKSWIREIRFCDLFFCVNHQCGSFLTFETFFGGMTSMISCRTPLEAMKYGIYDSSCRVLKTNGMVSFFGEAFMEETSIGWYTKVCRYPFVSSRKDALLIFWV